MADRIRRQYRDFLEPQKSGVDSYYRVEIDPHDEYGSVTLKIADCDRRVHLEFSKTKGRKAGLAKLAKLETAIAIARAEIESW